MIRNCPACGCLILDPTNMTRRHATYADCLRALLLEEQLRHRKIVEIMTAEIEKREALERDLSKAYEVQSV